MSIIRPPAPLAFKPDLTVSKWDGEALFKVKPDISDVSQDDKKLMIDGEQIDYKTDAKDYVYYDDPSASENGGYEFKIVLNEKPEFLKTTEGR